MIAVSLYFASLAYLAGKMLSLSWKKENTDSGDRRICIPDFLHFDCLSFKAICGKKTVYAGE